MTQEQPAQWLRHAHAALTVTWFLMVPVAIVTGWLWSLALLGMASLES